MLNSIVKLIFRTIRAEFVFKEAAHFFHKELQAIKITLSKKIAKMLGKALLWLFLLIGLVVGAVLGLVGLALYLNDLFYSSYKGFLAVSGGCMLVTLGTFLVVTFKK